LDELLAHKTYTSNPSSTYLDDLLKKNAEKANAATSTATTTTTTTTTTADGTVVNKTETETAADGSVVNKTENATDTTAATTGQVTEIGAGAIIDEAV
jgi:hypothetical protein